MKKICALAFIVTILDQLIKYLFTTFMTLGESVSFIPHFFSFTFVKNTGVAFSLFSGSQIPIIMLSIIVLFLLCVWIPKQKKDTWNLLSFGLLLGGIIGNLIDRIFRQGVLDYLDFELLGYDAPIFNLADIAVVVGSFLLLIIMWKEDKKCKNIL